jgi:hypothetical protein
MKTYRRVEVQHHTLVVSFMPWSENVKGRDNMSQTGIHERTILRWILRNWDVDWIHMVFVGSSGGGLL